ncbi:hypothetical protein N7E81_13595 [Reichenbachiella carrageenanivorans]|uniref:Outer membrane protein beta-barrel domain-containing protein n=1 Tax=Reichenbachiella carrageenanivorans TaxID=2979869 RepID=A0ABY6CYE3_9BACT|nr:hypothetical protein [Reichenbachiella carrageenanivorans]UXX78390.1 hypothetical protein N7E81_13595 [Reichenbachiella carrageenanivorans]
MQRLGLTILMGSLSWVAIANNSVREDTVVIELGERSKMVIYTENQQDLKELSNYDINAMIGELNSHLDSADVNTEEVVMKDDTGKYLREINEPEEEGNAPLVYYGDEGYEKEQHTDEDPYEQRYDRQAYDSRYDDIDEEEYVRVRRKSQNRRTYGTFEMDLGMNNWLENGTFPDNNNAAYAVKPWGSWYVGVGGAYHTPVIGPLKLKWGGNMTWYNWKLENTAVRITKTDTETTFVEDPNIDGKKSKLAATYINASLIPMLEFGTKGHSERGWNWSKYRDRGFRIGAGMYAGYRIDSWTKMKYSDNGDSEKDKNKGNYYLNNFRYGIRGQVGFRGMDLFFNYDLNSVFAEDRGPELQAISFGFIL